LFPGGALIEKVSLKYDEKLSACNSSTLLSKAAPQEIIVCDNIGMTLSQMDSIANSTVAAAIFISDLPLDFELRKGVR